MKIALLGLILAVAGCAHPKTVSDLLPGEHDPVAPHVMFHMDVAFTAEERADAAQAAKVWSVQTGGLANIDLVYDLDFDSPIGLRQIVTSGANYVVRYESDMVAVALADQESDCDACVLGWMTAAGVHNPGKKPVTGAFVADRITGEGIRIQVMIHEFGHALGLPHVAARQALMYPHAIPGRSACLKKSDLVAFCDVNECGDTKMIPCE